MLNEPINIIAKHMGRGMTFIPECLNAERIEIELKQQSLAVLDKNILWHYMIYLCDTKIIIKGSFQLTYFDMSHILIASPPYSLWSTNRM